MMHTWQPLDIPSANKNIENNVEDDEARYGFEAGYAAAMKAAEQKEKDRQSQERECYFNQIKKRLADIQKRLTLPTAGNKQGRVIRSVGLLLEVQELAVPVGELCHVVLPERIIFAVVTGFKENISYLMPLESMVSVVPGCRVFSTGKSVRVPVGPGLLGRVLDGLGRPLDNLGPLGSVKYESLDDMPINPLERQPIHETLDVGIKAIDALLTLGRGQRIGLFSTSGLGKSVLLGMMARYAQADVIVVCLVGERGREVRDFIESQLGQIGLERAVVVASPADDTPMMRVNSAWMAMRIASSFSREGKHVLVLMDSLSRVADAQREVALSMGEPVGLKGYPPSVFQQLGRLVEMAGCFTDRIGTVTALFTVLAQDEKATDPVASAARAVLDGHIVLSREYAEQGRYPAIDLEASVSRVMTQVTDKAMQDRACQFRRWHALYRENKDLISMGAYAVGHHTEADQAIQKHQAMEQFLRQDKAVFFNKAEIQALLSAVLEAEPKQKNLKQKETQP